MGYRTGALIVVWNIGVFALVVGGLPGAQAQNGPGRFDRLVSLEELIERAIANDLEIAALRASADVREAMEGEANPMRDPELRLGYSRRSGTAIPRPFTQRITETIRETGTRTRDGSFSEREDSSSMQHSAFGEQTSGLSRSGVSGADGTFSRTEREGGSSRVNELLREIGAETSRGSVWEDETFRNETTRVREREVTPLRSGGERIRETTTERTSGTFNENERTRSTGESQTSFSDRRTESGGTFRDRVDSGVGGSESERGSFSETRDQAGNRFEQTTSDRRESTSGRDTEEVMREEITEEEFFGDDPYAAVDTWSAEIRFYPRHPWEMKARLASAKAETTLAKQRVEAEARRLANEVRQDYLAAQMLLLEIENKGITVHNLTEILSGQMPLYERRAIFIDEIADSRADLLEAKVERKAMQRELSLRHNQLRSLAGLERSEGVDFTTPMAMRWLALKGLDLNALTEVALVNNARYAELVGESELVRSRLRLANAEQIPWINFVSLSFDYDERWGRKYRDEWGIQAGVRLPIQAWLRKEDSSDRVALEGLMRLQDLARAQLRRQLDLAVEDVRIGEQELSEYQAQGVPLREEMRQEANKLPAEHVRAMAIKLEVEKTLSQLHELELGLVEAYQRSLLGFEGLVGMDIGEVFVAGAPVAVGGGNVRREETGVRSESMEVGTVPQPAKQVLSLDQAFPAATGGEVPTVRFTDEGAVVVP